MCSLASDSQGTDMRSSLGGRIGPEDLEELAALPHRGERTVHGLGVPVALEIDEVDVFPGPALGRPRLDLGQVEPALREGLKNAEEHPGLVLHGEEDGGLVAPG